MPHILEFERLALNTNDSLAVAVQIKNGIADSEKMGKLRSEKRLRSKLNP